MYTKYNLLKRKMSHMGEEFEYIPFIYMDKEINICIPFFYEDHIQRFILTSLSFYELPKLEYFNSLVKRSFAHKYTKGGIIDAGANIGNHSLFFYLISGFSRVYCFEPLDTIRKILTHNIFLNNINATIFPYLLFNKKSYFELEKFDSHNYGATSFSEIRSRTGPYASTFLDNELLDSKISAIKVDAEGYEIPILEGASKILEDQHPILWVETFDYLEYLQTYLAKFGYKLDHNIMHDYFFV